MSPSSDEPPFAQSNPADAAGGPASDRALSLRIRQQEILAELGVMALQGPAFDDLLEQTARLTAEGLETEFCKVLEYLPDEKQFIVRAGVGWGEGVIGSARVGADSDSPAGFALHSGKPVISNHLKDEQRFRTPELLARHGVQRAMNVILQGDGAPFGVLEVDARTAGQFSVKDIAFLQGAANILGMAIERQRHERRLNMAIERQQILLKEIHHRVRNSLQLVASMLNLQASDGQQPDVRAQLQEASNRVLAVARAHERLYKGDEIGMLDIGEYLRDVCRDLNLSGSGCAVEVTAAKGLRLATDRAIPLALIATELITNAAKYAYPDDAKGKIHVDIARQDEGHILLTVADDGRGLPPDFSLHEARGLGMRIVRAFADKLDGKLEVRPQSPGSKFALLVPL